MDKLEAKRIYSNEYYNKNKAVIREKNLKKEECLLCGRFVIHQRMHKHYQTKYCIDRREVYKLIVEK